MVKKKFILLLTISLMKYTDICYHASINQPTLIYWPDITTYYGQAPKSIKDLPNKQ